MTEKIYTPNAPEAVGPYSQAIKTGGLVFTSGQIPINLKTGTIDADNITDQTTQVCKNIQSVLWEAGTSLENVIKTTCFLKNMDDFALFNEEYGKFFTSKPARSCVEVCKIPKGALVEIEVVAVCP